MSANTNSYTESIKVAVHQQVGKFRVPPE